MHIIWSLFHQTFSTYIETFSILFIVYNLYNFGRLLFDPLRTVPGPKWSRFTRLWLLRQIYKGDVQATQVALHEQYGEHVIREQLSRWKLTDNIGPVVRMAPGSYSINDLQAFRKIYGIASGFVKSQFYYPLGRIQPGHGTMFSERDEKLHAEKRKRVANLYTLTSMLSYETFVEQSNATLLQKLSEMASSGSAFSVTDWMQFYAFDVIGAITVGHPFGFLDYGYDFQGILNEIRRQQVYGLRLCLFAGYWHRLLTTWGPTFGWSPPREQTQKYVVDNIRQKRQALGRGEIADEHGGKQDFLEKLFALKDKGKVDELDVQLTVSTNINAGSDTTAISMSSIIYNLLRNPVMLQRLRDEIQEAKNSGIASDPITFKEAQELPYLQAVIKESLRVHPAVGMSLPRIVPEGGVTLAGHYFPAGTEVGVNPWVLHHNTDAFGPDAALFKPDRWLQSKEQSAAMDHYFFTFGGGSRTCIGRHISFLEMNTLIPELIMRFDLQLENSHKDWDLHNTFFVKQQFKCLVTEREKVEV